MKTNVCIHCRRPSPIRVLMKRARPHKGSIYCLAWNPLGNLIATGSNDKTVKIMRFNAEESVNEGGGGGGEQETELAVHDGTVRDLVFMGDSQTLVSGGAGDCKIYVTDCPSGQPVASLPGHGGHVLALSTWAAAGAVFASGSQVRELFPYAQSSGVEFRLFFLLQNFRQTC